VVVKTEQGQVPLRVFFSTDADLAVHELLHSYACRWSLEVWFRDAKQWLGWSDSSARLEGAVRRVAPWVALMSSAVVLWFAELSPAARWVLVPRRPWWPSKQNLARSDVVGAVRQVLRGVDLLSECRAQGNARKRTGRQRPLAVAVLPRRQSRVRGWPG
jgi:hypothetical protein